MVDSNIFTCLTPTSSVLFDGYIPTLSGLDRDAWASHLFTMYLEDNTVPTIFYTFISQQVQTCAVEVVLFNCPQWRISTAKFQFDFNSDFKKIISLTSCDSLVKVCVEGVTVGQKTNMFFSPRVGSRWVHLAQVSFHCGSYACPPDSVLSHSSSLPAPSFTSSPLLISSPLLTSSSLFTSSPLLTTLPLLTPSAPLHHSSHPTPSPSLTSSITPSLSHHYPTRLHPSASSDRSRSHPHISTQTLLSSSGNARMSSGRESGGRGGGGGGVVKYTSVIAHKKTYIMCAITLVYFTTPPPPPPLPSDSLPLLTGRKWPLY